MVTKRRKPKVTKLIKKGKLTLTGRKPSKLESHNIPMAHKKMPTREEIRAAIRLAREQAEAEKAAAMRPPDDGPQVEFISFNDQAARIQQLMASRKSMVVVNDYGGMQLYQLGFLACNKAYGLKWQNVTSLKTRTLLSVLWDVPLRTVEQEKAETIHAICELVKLCKMHLAGKCDLPAESKVCKRCAGTGDLLVFRVNGKEKEVPATAENIARYQPNIGGGSLCECPCQFAGASSEWKGECITAEELNALAGNMVVENKRAVYRDVRLILDMARDQTWHVDHEDLLWLPIVNNLPIQQYDLLVVDQPLVTLCEQEFVRRSGKKVLVIERKDGGE